MFQHNEILVCKVFFSSYVDVKLRFYQFMINGGMAAAEAPISRLK